MSGVGVMSGREHYDREYCVTGVRKQEARRGDSQKRRKKISIGKFENDADAKDHVDEDDRSNR